MKGMKIKKKEKNEKKYIYIYILFDLKNKKRENIEKYFSLI